MSRRLRAYQPGAVFHITARTQGRERLFTAEVRTRLVSFVREQVETSDVDLLAYVIMANHLHLIVRQGALPLGRLMQPLLRRIALLVQRQEEREGHVFGERFRTVACADPDHLRNAIVYAHLNPVRAGLCDEPANYAWSSHGAYLGCPNAVDGNPDPTHTRLALPLFARMKEQNGTSLRDDYLAYTRWRTAQDRHIASLQEGRAVREPAPPPVGHGDRHWTLVLLPRHGSLTSALLREGRRILPTGGKRPDLRDLMHRIVHEAGVDLDTGLLRSPMKSPRYVAVRRTIIVRAAQLGYRGVDIAAYLRISPRTVSDVIAGGRRARFSVRE